MGVKFGFSGQSKFFADGGDFVGKSFYILCSHLGTILFGIGCAYVGSIDPSVKFDELGGVWAYSGFVLTDPRFHISAGAGLLLYGGLGVYRDQKALADEALESRDLKKELESALEDRQAQSSIMRELNTDKVKVWLKSVCQKMGLSTSDRITIYYEYGGNFYLLARHSKNPNFSIVHRQKFPLNKGVISKAWEHAICFEESCPCGDDSKEYERYMVSNYGYEPAKIASLTMKSCRYLAKAIVDAGDNIGVIVFESIDPRFFEKNDADELRKCCRDDQSLLAKFVRDGINFDAEVNLRQEGKMLSVEEELLKEIEGKV